MTLTTIPTTRQSSSTTTTSSDVGLDSRYRGADSETYTGLSGAMSFNHVHEPVTWSKAALQVALAFPCPEAR